MKKLITRALFILILFTGIAGFKPQSPHKLHHSRSADNELFHRNHTSFTATGAIEGSGTWIMNVQHLGSALHCINTVTFSDGSGTLIIDSECNLVTMQGEWQIVSGTGDYVDASGNGYLEMAGPDEYFHGTIR